MFRSYYILLLCILPALLPGSLSAQPGDRPAEARPAAGSEWFNFMALQRRDAIDNLVAYHESLYIMSNYSGLSSSVPETLSIEELLQREVEGFCFHLRYDADASVPLARRPDGSFLPFPDVLLRLKDALHRDTTKVFTLFLDFHVEMDLQAAFDKAGLSDCLLEYDTGSGWPPIKTMIQTGKRMVVFEMQKHLNSPAWLHNLNDYATGLPSRVPETFAEKLRKSLFVYTGFQSLSLPEESDDVIVPYARQTPYLIEAFKRAWESEGKAPNFILVNRYYPWVTSLLVIFRGFRLVQGTIKSNNEYLNYVNWQGMSNYTSGKFSFPLEANGQLVLSPLSPGYDITPRSIRVANSGKKIYVYDFTARPLELEENLELYLPLNNNARDFSYKRNHGVPRNVEFVNDPVRGMVASFGAESRIDLPLAEELHIKNQDFTVTAWIKIPKFIENKTDYCILGTKNNAYQQGLHFLIREKKPYMGFFNNDLAGNTVLEAGKWYHLGWRYNKINGEQAIFVNGKLDAISLNRPAYLGSDSIYAGYADMSKRFQFIGALDNLSVWSRTLSDKEIMGLSNQLIELNLSIWTRFSRNLPLPLPGVFFLLLAAGAGYAFYTARYRKKTREREAALQASPTVLGKAPESNCILLFGDFYVADSDGRDVTPLFTPKLKQLFLLILLYSQQDKSGIYSRELTRIVWGEDSMKNIKSLRSVSILKLRKIVERIDKTEIVFNTNKYAIAFSEGVYCDYLFALQMMKQKKIKTREEFERFYRIIGRGEVFKGESSDWLDDFKGDVSNSIVDIISRFIGEYSLTEETDRIIQLADHILLNDPSNEDALRYKIQALNRQNNPRSAKYAYDRFCLLYQEMYGEEFKKTYSAIVSAQK
jgi:two-component SAPR family response regulator